MKTQSNCKTHLGGLAAARLTTNQHNLIMFNSIQDLIMTVCYWQLTSFIHHLLTNVTDVPVDDLNIYNTELNAKHI